MNDPTNAGHAAALDEIGAAFAAGRAIPYLGPGMLELVAEPCPLPASPEALVALLTAKVSVPHRIRRNLSGAAQFIENFKHRQTLRAAMTGAFSARAAPTRLHELLAAAPALPLLVHAWYDDLVQAALRARPDWSVLQGLSGAERPGTWCAAYAADGTPIEAEFESATLLYEPLGNVAPAANFVVSDSDYVEILTEIDIQTPIPTIVHERRRERHFIFLGCRFATQLERIFARQIMKRSSRRHWAVMSEPLTKNERRFVAEQGIAVLDLSLGAFTDALARRLEQGAATTLIATAS